MFCIIVGAGRLGSTLARQLADEGHEVLVVERDRRQVERLNNRLDVMAVVDSGLRLRSISAVEHRRPDLLVAATGSDEVNIITCMLARQIGVLRHVARLHSAELVGELEDLKRTVTGVDQFVNPRWEAVERLKNMVVSVGTTESAEFAEGKLLLRALLVEEGSPMTRKTLAELREDELPFVIAAVRRGEALFVPHGDASMLPGDTVYVVVERDGLGEFLQRFAFRKKTTSRVFVYGANRLGIDLVRVLEEDVRDVVLIDPDEACCASAAELLSRASIIHGSPLDPGLLEDLKIEGADYFLGVTENVESNLTACLVAKRLGVRTNVVLADAPEHVAFFEPLKDVDAVVSPIALSVGAILRSVREGRVLSLFQIAGQRGELLEIEVQSGSEVIGKKLADLELPEGIVLCGLTTRGGTTLPRGETVLHTGAHVLVMALASAVGEATSLFSGS